MRKKISLPFNGFFEDEKSQIKYIISDVDDTITSGGKLYPEVLSAMYRVKSKGVSIILLTGGSAGWSDGYIRQWPIDAVVAESGAVFLCHDKDGNIASVLNPSIKQSMALDKRRKLMEYTSAYPFSSDQFARVFDIAYDKAKMSEGEIKTLKNILTLFGATYSESSIHINAYFGSYNKKSALKFFMTEILGIKEEEYLERGIYVGDSLNDEPLFEYFPLSIGMHSVEDNKALFRNLPTYITKETSGFGWVEIASSLAKEELDF